MVCCNAGIELLGTFTIAAVLLPVLHCGGCDVHVTDSVSNGGGAGHDNCTNNQGLCWSQ
jgi:hypothetical protein